ncbi:MAG: metallophosphoesterase [Desulfobacterales bacterium]|nr:metallophosphoesterase [Desulfobacterales bacterium]
MRILATADWHVRDREIDEITTCLNFLVDTAAKEAVDLVVIAGDTFHSADTKLDSQSARLAIRTVSALADIAPIAILVGTASHDGKAPEIFTFARGQNDKIVSGMPEQLYLSRDGHLYGSWIGNEQPAAVITMIPPPTKQFFQSKSDISGADQEIGEAMSGLFAGFGAQAAEYQSPHILVGHFNVAGSMLSNGQVRTGMDIEIGRDQIALAGADVVCMGHIHLPQQIGESGIFYSSSIYAVNAGEDHPHGFWIFDLDNPDKGYVARQFYETPCRKIVRFKEDFATPDGVPAEYSDVQYLSVSDGPGPGDHAGEHIRLDFTAWQDEVALIQKDAIIERFKQAGAESVEIRITPVPRVTVRAEAVLKAETLRAEIEAMANLRGEQVAPEVLDMADLLEGTPTEKLLQMMTGHFGVVRGGIIL